MRSQWIALVTLVCCSTFTFAQDRRQDAGKDPDWVTGKIEERYVEYRPTIYPPIRSDSSEPACQDPPDDARILRALRPVSRGIPHLYEVYRESVSIVTERIENHIDPPRFYPLIGPACLHKCQYKATVSYDETVELTYLFTIKLFSRPRKEVVYMDRDHLHLEPEGSVKPEPPAKGE
jgi:hypothetical protein